MEAKVSELYLPRISRSVNMMIVPKNPDIKMGHANRRISERKEVDGLFSVTLCPNEVRV